MTSSAIWPRMELVDLTHPLCAGDAVYPGDPPLDCQPHATLNREGYRVTRLTMGTHLGTHVDAPSHYLAEGATVERLALDALVGPATVVDLPGEPGTIIEAEDLERAVAPKEPGARLLLRTGWDRYYSQARFYEDHPSLSLAAAQWLAARRLALVGFDTPSPAVDARAVHEVLLAAPSPTIVVESLANLGRLPRNVYLAVLPLKLSGLDGAPARAIAWLPPSTGDETNFEGTKTARGAQRPPGDG